MKTEMDKKVLESNNIIVKNKITAWPFTLFATAAITFGIAFGLENSHEAKMPFFLAGTIFAIFGIIKMLTLPKVLFYTTGEEPLVESTLYFEGIKRDCILALLDKGEFSKLKSMAKQNSNLPIKVEMHETASGSIVAYRVYSFIPYTYEPITNFLVYKKPL